MGVEFIFFFGSVFCYDLDRLSLKGGINLNKCVKELENLKCLYLFIFYLIKKENFIVAIYFCSVEMVGAILYGKRTNEHLIVRRGKRNNL